jgi:hypothetical protein
MAIVPGEEPPVFGEETPLLADEPLPPGTGRDIAEQVEQLDEQIRSGGSDEVEQADEAADAVEGDVEDAREGEADQDLGSDADADADPTSDEGADPEDPEAQR